MSTSNNDIEFPEPLSPALKTPAQRKSLKANLNKNKLINFENEKQLNSPAMMELNKAIANADNMTQVNLQNTTQTSFFSNISQMRRDRKKSITQTGNDHFDGVFGENMKDKFGKKLRQRAGTIKLDFNTAKALLKEFVPSAKVEGETGFRLTNKAAHFDYDIRPYEDKGIRAKKERDIE